MYTQTISVDSVHAEQTLRILSLVPSTYWGDIVSVEALSLPKFHITVKLGDKEWLNSE